MTSFSRGVTLGAIACAFVVAFGATNAFGLLGKLVDVRDVVVLPDEVGVGRATILTPQGAWLATVAYASGDAGKTLLGASVDRLATSSLMPAPTRGVLCDRGLCDNRTGNDIMLENVTTALRDDAARAGVVPQSAIAASFVSANGKAFYVAILKVDHAPPPGAPTIGVDDVLRNLTLACQNVTATAVDCGKILGLDAAIAWSPALRANATPTEGLASIVGPLAWWTTKTSIAASPPTLFVPTLALALVVAGIVACIVVQEIAERAFGNFFVPLPPAGIVLGAILLWRLDASTHAAYWISIPFWFVVLIVATILVYRLADVTGVQYYSLLVTMIAIGVATIVFLVRTLDFLASGPQAIVDDLFGSGAGGVVRSAAASALAWGLAIVAGSLLLNVIVATNALVEGRRALPASDLRGLVNDPAALQARLNQIRKAVPAQFSTEGYANAVARAYAARRHTHAKWWLKEGLKGDDLPDRFLDDLWERHKALAKRVQGRVTWNA